jgi:hypothetical protein
MVGELLCTAIFGRLSGHVPALIVEAAHQHRQARRTTRRSRV